MNVEINGSPILTTLPIFGGIPLTATLVVTWSIMLLLTLFCIWLTHDLRVDHVTTRQTVAEFLVNTAQNFVDSNMGTRFSHYAPFVAAIFSLSLLSSLSGLLGVFSPTADLSTELGAASHALFGLLPGVVGDLLSQIPFLSVGIPAVFSLYFDWFSSFMQAFIFCMLTMMYIAAAAEAD